MAPVVKVFAAFVKWIWPSIPSFRFACGWNRYTSYQQTRTIMKKLLLSTLVCTAMMATSFGFGGEHYRISFDGVQVVEYLIFQKKEIPELQVTSTMSTMAVRYDHCGQTGQDRKLTLVDSKGAVLKEWTFANESGNTGSSMMIDAKQLLLALRGTTGRSTLVYHSTSLQSARVLAYVK